MKSLREAAKISTSSEPVVAPTGLKPPKGKIVPKNNFPPKPEVIEEDPVAEEATIEIVEETIEIVEEPKPVTPQPVIKEVAKKEKAVVSSNIEDKFLNRLLKNMKSMLGDSHDENAISSKRVLAFLAFIFCAIGFFVDLFTAHTITPHIYDSMMWIVVAGIGISGLEKFAPKE